MPFHGLLMSLLSLVPGAADLQDVTRLFVLAYGKEELELVCTWGWVSATWISNAKAKKRG